MRGQILTNELFNKTKTKISSRVAQKQKEKKKTELTASEI